MSTLADSQALLQSIVTGRLEHGAAPHAPPAARLIQETPRFPVAARLGVYRASYRSRLAESVREFFPCLKFALGSEVFDSLANEFLWVHPPTHPNLSRLVEAFPDYLQAARSSFADPNDPSWPDFLVELARLELAFHHAYNAIGPELLPPFDLTHIAPGPNALAAALSLMPSPCLRLISMQYPTAEFFADFRTGKQPRFPMRNSTFAALSRRAFNVDITHLSGDQHSLLSSLMNGLPVQKCLFAPTSDCPEVNGDVVARRWQWIQCWVNWRLFVGEAAASFSSHSA